MSGAFMSAGDYVQAGRRRLEMISAVEGALRDVDILLCASAMDPPSPIDNPEEVERTYPRQARTPFNVTGHPALAMMSGLSSGGLPYRFSWSAATSANRRCFKSRGNGSARRGQTISIHP
jgi:aspartyl-tRNA(Asn)/glutamyl-tRNA(Gln) amidotransferase subunit A